jgi:hypothetical protein
MGVAVAIWLPNRGWPRWFWGIAFGLVGVLTIAASVKVVADSGAAQKTLSNDIKGLKDAIDKLTQPLTKPSPLPQRDPDTIYQNNSPAGRVIAPRITLNESKIYFDEIQNAGNLDTNKTFEYRDFILHMTRADSFIGMLVTPSGVATSVYQHVVCEIVGRANH